MAVSSTGVSSAGTGVSSAGPIDWRSRSLEMAKSTLRTAFKSALASETGLNVTEKELNTKVAQWVEVKMAKIKKDASRFGGVKQSSITNALHDIPVEVKVYAGQIINERGLFDKSRHNPGKIIPFNANTKPLIPINKTSVINVYRRSLMKHLNIKSESDLDKFFKTKDGMRYLKDMNKIADKLFADFEILKNSSRTLKGAPKPLDFNRVLEEAEEKAKSSTERIKHPFRKHGERNDQNSQSVVVPPKASGNVAANPSTNANISASGAQPKASGTTLIDASTNATAAPQLGLLGRGLRVVGGALTVFPVGVTTYNSIVGGLGENYDLTTKEGLIKYINAEASKRTREYGRHLDIGRMGLSSGLSAGVGSLAGAGAGLGTGAASLAFPPLAVTVPYVSFAAGVGTGMAAFSFIDANLKKMQDGLLEIFFATSENKKRIELMQKFKQLFAARDMYQSLGKAKNIREYLRAHPNLDSATKRNFESQAKELEKRVLTISKVYNIEIPK